MKKAVLTDRIYMNYDESLLPILKEALTYKVPKYVAGKIHFISIRTYTIISDCIISFPVGRIDLIPADYTIVEKRVKVPANLPKFKYTLRPSQQEICDDISDNCIINADPSWGKTFTGVAVASKLQQKTLIITHTVFLREQWEKEIKKTLGITPGIIGSGMFQIEPDIIVANVQTLNRRFDEVNDTFGLVIIDECHHTPATTFLKVVDRSKARYKIGLSATLKRKDGYHVILRDIFGSKVYTPPIENRMEPIIKLVDLPVTFIDDAAMPWAHRVTNLLEKPEYLAHVLDIIDGQAKKGHKVLVLSERNDILQEGYDILRDNSILITGESPKDDRNRLQNQLLHQGKDIVFGSMKIFSEGISVPCLSSLVILTPMNNDSLLAQVIGRIVRIEENKLQPEVIDIRLRGRTARRQALARQSVYMKAGYKMTHVTLAE